MPGVSVYVTAESMEQATMIARAVVSERLAACANILGNITSVYRWDGELHEDREVAILLKTRRSLIDRLTDRLKDLHSYECPCVTAFEIVGGNADYLDWIETETS